MASPSLAHIGCFQPQRYGGDSAALMMCWVGGVHHRAKLQAQGATVCSLTSISPLQGSAAAIGPVEGGICGYCQQLQQELQQKALHLARHRDGN